MIYIILESLPPSVNQAYWNNPKGGRVLTKAGKAYKADVTNYLVKHHATDLKQLKKNAALGVLVALGFPDMLTNGFPDKAKHRFTRLDIDNRSKLLMDAIVEATSIDDSQFLYDFKYKYHSDRPQTIIYLWNEDGERIGQQLLGSFAQIAGYTRAV